MYKLMWTAGRFTSVPDNSKIIHNGRELELEYVGTIEEVGYIGWGVRWHLSAFEFVVTFLLQKANRIFSAENFVNTLLRMYAVSLYISKNYLRIANLYEQYCG